MNREIEAEKEKLEVAMKHSEEIRAQGLDLDSGQTGIGEAQVKVEVEE